MIIEPRWKKLLRELWRMRFELLFGITVIAILDTGVIRLDPRSFTALALNAAGKSAIGGAIGFSSWSAVHWYIDLRSLIQKVVEGGPMASVYAELASSTQRSRALWVVGWIVGMNLIP